MYKQYVYDGIEITRDTVTTDKRKLKTSDLRRF